VKDIGRTRRGDGRKRAVEEWSRRGRGRRNKRVM